MGAGRFADNRLQQVRLPWTWTIMSPAHLAWAAPRTLHEGGKETSERHRLRAARPPLIARHNMTDCRRCAVVEQSRVAGPRQVRTSLSCTARVPYIPGAARDTVHAHLRGRPAFRCEGMARPLASTRRRFATALRAPCLPRGRTFDPRHSGSAERTLCMYRYFCIGTLVQVCPPRGEVRPVLARCLLSGPLKPSLCSANLAPSSALWQTDNAPQGSAPPLTRG